MDSIDANVLNAMRQGGKPLVSYRKTMLGKVFVHIWNSFLESPEGIILSGKPNSETAIYDIWNERELAYFESKNRRLVETGNIIVYKRPDTPKVKEKLVEEFSDEELIGVLKQKFFAFRSFLDNLISVPVLYRLVSLAEGVGKPSKTVDAIKARLAQVQNDELTGVSESSGE